MANEELKKVIGHNVRRFRLKAGFSQAQLAEMVDRDASAITNIEGGKRMVGVELLCSFAAIFSVSVDTLLQIGERIRTSFISVLEIKSRNMEFE